MNERTRITRTSTRRTRCPWLVVHLSALGLLVLAAQPAIAGSFFPCTGCSTQISSSTLACLYAERAGYQADLQDGLGSKAFLTSCIKKINAAIAQVKNQSSKSAADAPAGSDRRLESEPQVKLFSLTEADLKRLNSLELRDVACDGCAKAVLRIPVPVAAAQPACPETTHPGCIWVCDSDDPLDGFDDSCSTNRWNCFGCGNNGETVCDPSPC